MNRHTVWTMCLLAIVLPQSMPRAAPAPATTRAAEDAALEDLQERALRDLDYFAEYEGTRFVLSGYDEAGEPIDPTAAFLARFEDLQFPVKPVSSARRIGKGHDEKGRPRMWHYEDPETGRPARVYYSIVKKRRDDGSVPVDVGFSSGPLSGGGRHVIYRLSDGAWKLVKVVSWYVG